MTYPGGLKSEVSLRAVCYGGPSDNVTRSELDLVTLHRDLAIAREVQRASFPQQPPPIPGLKCASFYKPARSVGGDYYDFLALPTGTWGIAIGDVSGKGIGAALVMANLQGSLRTQVLQSGSDIETLITDVNRLVWESSPQHFFASLFYAEYRPQSRVLRYVNAGHNAPIVVRRDRDGYSLLPLKPEFAPVGVLKDTKYKCTTFQLEIGDILVAYTDGVTESENFAGIAFGHRRLERILCDCRMQDPHNILQLVLDELSAHSGDCPQADDITLVVLKVEASDLETSRACNEGWSGALIDQVCHLRRSLRQNSICGKRVVPSLSLLVEKPV
jgi:phosphoserine phosphatase RsbU/P